jgi:hypothetical protein
MINVIQSTISINPKRTPKITLHYVICHFWCTFFHDARVIDILDYSNFIISLQLYCILVIILILL